MNDPLAAFLRHLAVERNASPHTLRSYRNDLTDFQRFLSDRGSGDLAAADQRAVRAWLAALHARGLQPASIGRKLAAARSCFRFLVRRGRLETNPARELRGPRQPRRLVSFLPIDEAIQLVSGRAVGGSHRERDVAILELLYASGLRVSELTGLDLEALDRSERTVRVLGKGRKERIVPYGGQAARAVEAWLARRGEADGPLFTNAQGRRLTVRSIHTIVGRAARAAVELAKDWRSDRVLRRLEALLAVADQEHSFIISGTGDVIEPDDGLIGIGSGGPYALAAARALVAHADLDAKAVVTEAMRIAAAICIYTNDQISEEVL